MKNSNLIVLAGVAYLLTRKRNPQAPSNQINAEMAAESATNIQQVYGTPFTDALVSSVNNNATAAQVFAELKDQSMIFPTLPGSKLQGVEEAIFNLERKIADTQAEIKRQDSYRRSDGTLSAGRQDKLNFLIKRLEDLNKSLDALR